jgi:hypothetical protein
VCHSYTYICINSQLSIFPFIHVVYRILFVLLNAHLMGELAPTGTLLRVAAGKCFLEGIKVLLQPLHEIELPAQAASRESVARRSMYSSSDLHSCGDLVSNRVFGALCVRMSIGE